MNDALSPRVFMGMAAGTCAAVAVSFVAACFFSVLMVLPNIPRVEELPQVFLFVGGAAALAGAIISLVLFVLVGLPLYAKSLRKGILSLGGYALAGFATALTVAALITLAHIVSQFLVKDDFYLALFATLVGGPTATSVFWMVVRPDHRRI